MSITRQKEGWAYFPCRMLDTQNVYCLLCHTLNTAGLLSLQPLSCGTIYLFLLMFGEVGRDVVLRAVLTV